MCSRRQCTSIADEVLCHCSHRQRRFTHRINIFITAKRWALNSALYRCCPKHTVLPFHTVNYTAALHFEWSAALCLIETSCQSIGFTRLDSMKRSVRWRNLNSTWSVRGTLHPGSSHLSLVELFASCSLNASLLNKWQFLVTSQLLLFRYHFWLRVPLGLSRHRPDINFMYSGRETLIYIF
jgi:hypothetical protein